MGGGEGGGRVACFGVEVLSTCFMLFKIGHFFITFWVKLQTLHLLDS